jgi:hypothetical protein
MSLLGTVSSGVVVLDPGPTLPDGTRVEVRTVTVGETTKPTGTLAGLLKFAGKAEGMPADFAAQHDHYIHGTPKR